MRFVLAVVGLASLGACSILYDPNNIDRERADAAQRPDGSGLDAGDDAMSMALADAEQMDAIPDAAPGDLSIGVATPASVVEATGAGGGRPVVVVLAVENFTGVGTTYVVSDIVDNGALVPVSIVGQPLVSTDMTKVAIALRIPVLPSTAQGVSRSFNITIAQTGSTSAKQIAVTGLDEFSPQGTVDTGSTTPLLRPLYSRVRFENPVHFTGAFPALIRSQSDIELKAAVDVDGIGMVAGAHGCDGGASAAPGGCSPGNGGAGASNGLGVGKPGGGGGFGANGGGGAGGTGAGAGGTPTGDDWLVNLTAGSATAAGNRGNGGGGGGSGLLGAPGGAGGGGGGVLELTANGNLTVSAAGVASARGGNGAAGSGDGGGGSGGAVVIRASGGISTAAAGWVRASAGIGSGANSAKAGDGSVGRVRFDLATPTANAATMVTGLTPKRGAAWAADAPLLVNTQMITAKLVGALGQSYAITLNDAAHAPALIGGDNTVDVPFTLVAGANKLCAFNPGALLANAESIRCIQVVYLP